MVIDYWNLFDYCFLIIVFLLYHSLLFLPKHDNLVFSISHLGISAWLIYLKTFRILNKLPNPQPEAGPPLAEKSQCQIKSKIQNPKDYNKIRYWDLRFYCLPASARLWQAGKLGFARPSRLGGIGEAGENWDFKTRYRKSRKKLK